MYRKEMRILDGIRRKILLPNGGNHQITQCIFTFCCSSNPNLFLGVAYRNLALRVILHLSGTSSNVYYPFLD